MNRMTFCGINMQSLRPVSEQLLFKPVPDGFEIEYGRKVLPVGETE